MGPLAAGSLTSAALRRWQPDHLLLVGIAGGMPEEANGGDVVVPQFVASDILGRYGGDDRRTVRWVQYEIDESMLDSAMNFRDGWQDLIAAEPPEPVTSRRRAAVVLSGGNVVASPAIAAQYGETWDGKAGAIEMEAAGVAAATRGFRKRPAFFMIRGVSDPVNSLSNDEFKERWRAYAADVAAAYAIGLIRSDLMEVRDDWTLGCPAHGSSCYRWLFARRDWNEEPWWALHNDPRERGGTDETEMGWLIEAAAAADPRDVSPLVRRWLADVIHLSAGDIAGFANQPRIGALLEQLSGTPWVHELAAAFRAEKLQALFDDAAPSHVRAGLRIWGESNHESLLEPVARMMVKGPSSLRPYAARALDRWFARRGSVPSG